MHQTNNFDFVLSPNPVSGNKLKLFIETLPSGDYQFEIFDTSGQLMQIREYKVLTEKGSVNIKLNIDNLDAGLYIVRMISGKAIVEKKFIRQ